MLPPKETALENVTKSPCTAPCALSVTVKVEEPLVAAKVAVFVVFFRIGVMSLYVSPSSM